MESLSRETTGSRMSPVRALGTWTPGAETRGVSLRTGSGQLIRAARGGVCHTARQMDGSSGRCPKRRHPPRKGTEEKERER